MEFTKVATGSEGLAASTLSESEKRQRIASIMRDATKTPQDRQRCIEEIRMGRVACAPSSVSAAAECDYDCSHYEKKCSKFLFACCGNRDNCVRCHRERRSCVNPKLAEITCVECDTSQEPAHECISCKVLFSKSFCAVCNIWTAKDIFHCSGCGLCRVGMADKMFHCTTCNACFPSSGRASHQCAFGRLDESDCPICHEDIHSSQKEANMLPCGHVVHSPCFMQSLQSGNYRCPVCRKSMCDMKSTWAELKHSVALQPMPEEKMVDYVCYDCSYKARGAFHFLGIECAHCNSFNTAM